MNWIKLTNDINILIGTELLINTINNGIKKVSVIENITEFVVEEKIDIENDNNTVEYGIAEYSHYCVITEPEDSKVVTTENNPQGLTYKDDLTKGVIIKEDVFRKHTYINEYAHLIKEIEKGAQIRLHKATDYDNGVSSIQATIFFFPKDD